MCSCWIQYNLTIAQRKVRVNCWKETLEKYNSGASKDVYKIVTGDESWNCAYEPETKQQSTVWVFEDELNPMKVVCGKITLKQMLAYFFCKTGHVATVPLKYGQFSVVHHNLFAQSLRRNSKTNNASSHILAQISALLTAENVELMVDSPWLNTQWLLFICSPEDAVEAFKRHVLELSQSKWKKKHKWWSYIKTFLAASCTKMSNFPMEMSDCSWQQQKYARPEIYVATIRRISIFMPSSWRVY